VLAIQRGKAEMELIMWSSNSAHKLLAKMTSKGGVSGQSDSLISQFTAGFESRLNGIGGSAIEFP